jgi:hypothetical protein
MKGEEDWIQEDKFFFGLSPEHGVYPDFNPAFRGYGDNNLPSG